MNLYAKLKGALKNTASKIGSGIDNIFVKKKLDSQTLEELEELLLCSDVGSEVTEHVVGILKKSKFEKNVSSEEIKNDLANIVQNILDCVDHNFLINDSKLNVILLCGVNGTGKTTTIGKLAAMYMKQGKKVAIAACDTFRAAAVDQIENWADNAGALFFKSEDKADPASVAYKAVNQSIEKNVDVLFIDTAGRLHNHNNLMQELEKIIRVIKKIDPGFPNHTLLTVDGSTGQNALIQVESFKKIANITGIVATKLDGTAKAGVLIGIVKEYKLPIHFVGIGEKEVDIKPFSAKDFSTALVGVSRISN